MNMDEEEIALLPDFDVEGDTAENETKSHREDCLLNVLRGVSFIVIIVSLLTTIGQILSLCFRDTQRA